MDDKHDDAMPAPGELLRLTSADSFDFSGPFEAKVVERVTLTNGKTGLAVEVVPAIYFGTTPLQMRELSLFVLVARAAKESLSSLPPGVEMTVHIAEAGDWSLIHGNHVATALLTVLAWGEVARVTVAER